MAVKTKPRSITKTKTGPPKARKPTAPTKTRKPTNGK